jgi:hypothetical protein
MSVWSRLFGPSKPSRPASKLRPGLESLEAREVPAIVFVGGWGASSYQYAAGGPHEAADVVPSDQFSLSYAKVRYDSAPAVADTVAIRAESGDDSGATRAGAGNDVYQWDPGDGADAVEGRSAATDDVWVDGRVITGENYDSATVASSGYIKVKKLNSG